MSLKRRSFDESDLIRLRLQRLEEQTTDRPLIERLFSTAPTLPFAVAFLIGIAIASRISSTRALWMIVCLSVSLTFLFLFLSLKAKPAFKILSMLTASALVMFALGTVRYYSVLDRSPEHICHYLKSERELATLKGRIVSSIRTDPLQTGISSVPWLSSKSSF